MSVVRVERDVADIISKVTPFIAFPLAFYLADKILRRKKYFTKGMALRYFLGAPALVFLTLLALVSMPTLVFAPITFIFGLYYGLLPLIFGTMIHCFGMMPLYFLPMDPAGALVGDQNT